MEACPNIEELHVSFGNFCSDETGMAETRKFFSTIRFEKLKWLTVDRLFLRDGSRFPLVKVSDVNLRLRFILSNCVYRLQSNAPKLNAYIWMDAFLSIVCSLRSISSLWWQRIFVI